MLERTAAAGLESVLPRSATASARPLRRPRKPPGCFAASSASRRHVRHDASAAASSDAGSSSGTSPARSEPPLILDFLYPRHTPALLLKKTEWYFNQQPARAVKLGSRQKREDSEANAQFEEARRTQEETRRRRETADTTSTRVDTAEKFGRVPQSDAGISSSLNSGPVSSEDTPSDTSTPREPRSTSIPRFEESRRIQETTDAIHVNEDTTSGRERSSQTDTGTSFLRSSEPPSPKGTQSDAGASSPWNSEPTSPKETYVLTDEGEGHGTIDSAEREADQGAVEGTRSTSNGILEDLLADPEGQLYHDVWDLYVHESPDDREKLRPRILSYLSRSQSVVEAGRVLSLFRQTPVEDWDNDFMSGAILVMLRAGERERGLETFKKGLSFNGLTGGFEYILIDSVNQQQWGTALDAWLSYCKHSTKNDASIEIDDSLLETLTSIQLDSLGALYFSLERYLAADDMRVERWLELDPVTKAGLRVFRRKFAIEALRHPCPPKQATVILAFWRDHWMYDRYLWRMFDRWYKKTISLNTAHQLSGIYRDFMTLPGAKPNVANLRGIFKLHAPQNLEALQDLYSDWIKCYGELSQWAFEKYLKLYASYGDVTMVKQLWERFVKLYPHQLKQNRGFRSIMNVHAQAGDIEGLERDLDIMINEYNVTPDVDTWNTLLKCHVRRDDYSKTMACFEDVCNAVDPDSFTYTHVMAMSSKKGDLDRTIELFKDAEARLVPVSKEMALALVVAFCHNDKLNEAEKVTLDFANRRITSAAIWNQLIYFNGVQGRIHKCYELLRQMQERRIEWDGDSVGSLLQALVRVGRINDAFQVIRDCIKNRRYLLRSDHFGTVMAGAMKKDNRWIAESLVSQMEKLRMPIPFNTLVPYTQTSLNTAPNTVRTTDLRKQLVASLQEVADGSTRDVRQLNRKTEGMGRAIRVLVQFRDFVSAEELLNIFMDVYPQFRENEVLPQDVISSLMLAYFRDENYDRVIELWDEAWPKILKRCSIIQPGGYAEGIYPAHQYDVTRLVFRLAKTYRATKDGNGLLETVEKVMAAGFRLTSSTWDQILRGLAELGKWERAMYWCETVLMRNWRGWNPPPLGLTERREAMNPRYLEPTTPAVQMIMEQWLALRRLSIWSTPAGKKLEDMERRYPMMHDAFSRSHQEPWVLRGDVDMAQAMESLLSPLSHKELKHMQKVLKEELKNAKVAAKLAREKGENPDDEDSVLFRRYAKGSKEETRALMKMEMDILKSALRMRLTKETAASEETVDVEEKEQSVPVRTEGSQ